MKANYRNSYTMLPKQEKRVIDKIVLDLVEEQVNKEEAQVQKVWIQMACIILHNYFDFTEGQVLMFLGNWKNMYRKNRQLANAEEQTEWLKSQLTFFKDGFPYEFLNDMEKL